MVTTILHSKLVSCHHKVLIDQKLQVHIELMSCDKDFGYVRVNQGLTCGRYGDL